MPACPLDFRQICGGFMPRRQKIKMAPDTEEISVDLEMPDLVGCLIYGLLIGIILLRYNALILCGDVELNPGPGTDVINDKLNQIIDSLAEQKQTLAEQKETLKHQTEVMKKYERGQREVRSEIETLKKEIEDLKQSNEKQERYSRRKNVRIYGVPESQGSSETTVYKLLDKYFPKNEFELERAHRLGRDRPQPEERPRPLICRFLNWQDTMSVMRNKKSRDQMKKEGISVAQDLTPKQFEELREMKDQGKRGYFFRGRLYEKSLSLQSSQSPPDQETPPRNSPYSRDSSRSPIHSDPSANDKRGNSPARDRVLNLDHDDVVASRARTQMQKATNDIAQNQNRKHVETKTNERHNKSPIKKDDPSREGPVTRSRQSTIHESMGLANINADKSREHERRFEPTSTDDSPAHPADVTRDDENVNKEDFWG